LCYKLHATCIFPMNILIIDNYDSFTFNLYQYVGEILKQAGSTFTLDVFRNDKITVKEILAKGYERIVISPGPGDPSDKAYFGVCADVLTTVGKEIPVMGVCLGMQGMAHYFGGKVVRARLPMHGKTSLIVHDSQGFFHGLPQDIEVMRYHSLVADPSSLPDDLIITAVVKTEKIKQMKDLSSQHEEIEIMGLRHKTYPIEGIQFHPESFATEGGKEMLYHFLFQK
jgi:anthranilate synthase component II